MPYGKPTYWNASGNQIWASAVKDLFSGERWIPEISMYDLRNRFYSPDLGRFLQPDPIGFKGDASNLYRYCGNDWASKTDPLGLMTSGDPVRNEITEGSPDNYDPNHIAGTGGGQFSKMQSMGAAQVGARMQAHNVEIRRTEAWAAEHSESQNLSTGQVSNTSGAEVRRATPVHNIGVYNPAAHQFTIFFKNGAILRYPAGNNTNNPTGNPFKGGIHSPFPHGRIWKVDHIERYSSSDGQDWIDYGPAFFKIGSPGTIAYTRGTGLHAGTNSHLSLTNGCLRISTQSMNDLLGHLDRSGQQLEQVYAYPPGE